MYIITGANGRVGSAVVKELRKRGLPVTAIIRDKNKTGMFSKDITVKIADIFDVDSLATAFEGGDTVFLITPENPLSSNVLGDAEKIIENYRKAVVKSGIKRVVGLSSMGADLGEGSGNLMISHMLEHAFQDLKVEATFIRPAYYYSNWDHYINTMKEYGVLPAFFEPTLKFAMIAPSDVAEFATIVMRSKVLSAKVYEIAGPQKYSPDDVARISGQYLGRKITVQQIPSEKWIESLTGAGFSENAAENMAAMTRTIVDGKDNQDYDENLIVFGTELETYLGGLID